jgi:hypothetical protein
LVSSDSVFDRDHSPVLILRPGRPRRKLERRHSHPQLGCGSFRRELPTVFRKPFGKFLRDPTARSEHHGSAMGRSSRRAIDGTLDHSRQRTGRRIAGTPPFLRATTQSRWPDRKANQPNDRQRSIQRLRIRSKNDHATLAERAGKILFCDPERQSHFRSVQSSNDPRRSENEGSSPQSHRPFRQYHVRNHEVGLPTASGTSCNDFLLSRKVEEPISTLPKDFSHRSDIFGLCRKPGWSSHRRDPFAGQVEIIGEGSGEKCESGLPDFRLSAITVGPDR